MTEIKRAGAAGVLIALLTATHPARADDRASAMPLFEEGRRLMTAGKVAEACSKFEAASHLTSTAGVRLNLAACWAKLGRTASAWAMYDEARVIADRNGDAAATQIAQKGKAELEPRLTRLTVTVAAGNPVGLSVTRDGQPVYSGAWGVGLPVDPGEHEIAVQAPGRKDWSAKVSVRGEGNTGSIAVPVLERSGTESPTVPPEPEPKAAANKRAVEPLTPGATPHAFGTARTIGVVVGGVGAAGVVAGIVTGSMASASWSTAQGECPSHAGCSPKAISDRNSANTFATASTIAFVAGGALVAVGVTVYLVAPRTSAPSVGVTMAPDGAWLVGNF